jgi:hypothetical protein
MNNPNFKTKHYRITIINMTFIQITSKKKDSEPNCEFKVCKTTTSNMNSYSNKPADKPYTILESEIINDINNNDTDYRTKDSNGSYTKCEVGVRKGIEYLKSKPNDDTSDNIDSLPEYD